MATIYANAEHAIIRFLDNYAQEVSNPSPPAGTAETLVFDETTNSALVADMHANFGLYTVSGGQLLKNGVVVPINAAGQARTDLLAVPELFGLLVGNQDLTPIQLRVLLRAVCREALGQ